MLEEFHQSTFEPLVHSQFLKPMISSLKTGWINPYLCV
jgi:hypothetical protein